MWLHIRASKYGNSILLLSIDHFTVVCLVAWPLNESEAGVDLVLIETSLLFIWKFILISMRTASLTWEKQGGFYQNKVTSSLTFIHFHSLSFTFISLSTKQETVKWSIGFHIFLSDRFQNTKHLKFAKSEIEWSKRNNGIPSGYERLQEIEHYLLFLSRKLWYRPFRWMARSLYSCLYTILHLPKELGWGSNFNQLIIWHHHMKDHAEMDQSSLNFGQVGCFYVEQRSGYEPSDMVQHPYKCL